MNFSITFDVKFSLACQAWMLFCPFLPPHAKRESTSTTTFEMEYLLDAFTFWQNFLLAWQVHFFELDESSWLLTPEFLCIGIHEMPWETWNVGKYETTMLRIVTWMIYQGQRMHIDSINMTIWEWRRCTQDMGWIGPTSSDDPKKQSLL